MPGAARATATRRVAKVEKAPSADRSPAARPRIANLQDYLLHQQRTAGNRAVQKLITSGLPNASARTSVPPQQGAVALDGQAPEHPAADTAQLTFLRAQAAAIADAPRATSTAPAVGGAARSINLRPIRGGNTAKIQRAWYNISIPFTDYELDPSWEGVKTAAGVVKDTAVAAVDWIVDKIKELVSSGIEWLTDKWHEIQDFASSAFDSVKNVFGNILSFVKNPLGFLADAIMAFDGQSLQRAWERFSKLLTTLSNGFKAMADSLLLSINKVWGGINGFATSLLDRVAGLTQTWVFRQLPSALQNIAFSVIDKLKSLWKTINDGWTTLFNKIKGWIDAAIDKVFSFVRRVLSFGINVVIAGIIEFGQIILFLKDLFSNPEKYVEILGQKSVAAFEGVESKFTGLISQYFGSPGKAAPESTTTVKIQRQPAPGASADPKRRASWGEIGSGILDMMGKKWDEFKANPWSVVKGLLIDMIFPIVGNIKDVIQLFKDIKSIVTGPLSAGSLEELWTSLLQILDIPILIYRTVVSILMRTLMIPLIVASFIPHPIVKGIAAAVGYALLGAFVQGEVLNLTQKLLLLKTGVTRQAQKEEAYNRIADSLIALAMTAVIIIVMLILHFLASVAKGVYNFVRGKVFGIEPTPVEGKGTSGEGKGDAPEAKAPREGIPSEDNQRKIRINDEGKCEVCASPCDEVRKKYASVMTPEIEAKIKLIEDDTSLTELQQEEKLKPIEQELKDLQDGKTTPAAPKRVIKVDNPARIEATKPIEAVSEEGGHKLLNWQLFDSESGARFSDVDVDMSDPANPGAPDQLLTPKEATLADGTEVKLEADFSWTDESLKKNQKVWEEIFKKPLADYSGSLGKENLGNFQFEYDRIRAEKPGLSPQQIGDFAIREVSFGKGRIRVGFGDLSVTIEGFEEVTIKEGPHAGKTVKDVPTTVKVSAKKTL